MATLQRQSHNPFWKAVAALLMLIFGATLAAPCAHAWEWKSVASVRPVDLFAALSPQAVAAAHAKVCSCASCPGSHGGKCCCANAATAGEGFAFRAVCDTAPDAATSTSPLPPIRLMPRVSVIAPQIAPALPAPPPAAPRLFAALDAPLPPDAPPRLS